MIGMQRDSHYLVGAAALPPQSKKDIALFAMEFLSRFYEIFICSIVVRARSPASRYRGGRIRPAI
jgi:hypothetical protein